MFLSLNYLLMLETRKAKGKGLKSHVKAETLHLLATTTITTTIT